MRPALAALLLTVASAAGAQQFTGRCVDGNAWTGGASFASYGSCEAPEEDALLTLSCRGGATELDIFLPFAAGDGAPVDATLFVGRLGSFHVSGTAQFQGLSGEIVLTGAPVGFALVEALASGSGGSVETQTSSNPFHLTDSRGAIETMRATCR